MIEEQLYKSCRKEDIMKTAKPISNARIVEARARGRRQTGKPLDQGQPGSFHFVNASLTKALNGVMYKRRDWTNGLVDVGSNRIGRDFGLACR